jgi:phage gp36-like protein
MSPAASGVLYATVADLRDVLSSTDSGVGTPAQLSDEQLTLALYSASNRVSVYSGVLWDSSAPQWVPPPILHDITLDLAAFFAWKTYLKGKSIASDHPAFIAYQNATSMLNDVRDGKIRLDVEAAGAIGPEDSSLVINRIPQIFTGYDSNTRVNGAGVLEDDVTPNTYSQYGDWLGSGGAVYQG